MSVRVCRRAGRQAGPPAAEKPEPGLRLAPLGADELTCEAQKLEGSEGFMIVFRAETPGSYYWINFGGWGNKEHGIQKHGGGWNLPRVAGSVEQGKWHKVRIRCEGPRFQIWLDDEKVFDATDPQAFLSGSVGFSVYDTRSQFRNGPVTSKYGRLRAENGHPEPYNVKYWEIDNEMWGMGEERYNEAIAEFAPAMRAAWPDTEIIVCGSYGYDDGQGCTDGWDQRIIDANAQNFDYISIHYYNGLRRAADYVDDPRRYEAFIRDLGRRLRESENPNALIYCSEYGMMTDFGGTGPDWRSGLYTAALLNGFERAGDVLRIAGPALFLRRTWATMWDNALINFDHRTRFGGGNYVATKLWRDHYAPDLLEMEGPDRPLNATAVRTEDGRAIYFKVVNPKQHAVELELTVKPGFTVGDASMRIINPGDDRVKNSLAEPDALRIESHPVRQDSQTIHVHLPAISAGALTLSSAN